MGIDRLTMFLANKWNIKEVLLFPAMKPTDEMAERLRQINKRQPEPGVVTTHFVGSSAVTSAALPNVSSVVSGESKLLGATDLGTLEGLQRLQGLLVGKSFLKSIPSSEDAFVFAALAKLPVSLLRAVPEVYHWYQTMSQFTDAIREAWP